MSRQILRTAILNPNIRIGSKIKAAREKAGLSQLKMAEAANEILMSKGAIAFPLHRSEIARLESGERGLKYLEAWAIARVLKVKSEDFLPE